MCSISGIANYNTSPDALRGQLDAMNCAQAHRGPDGGGVWYDGSVGLAHRRLAVIDLSERGNQPMLNKDKTIAVVLNGEIYNFRELRRNLEQLGHKFYSNSDTESVIHLYEEYGEKAISMLSGMFALAIYDANKNELLLARDRMGQKPLVYFIVGKKLVFASEISALSCDQDMPRKLDLVALGEYFSLQYIGAPRTIYKDVFKLEPATYLKFNINTGMVDRQRYWSVGSLVEPSPLAMVDLEHEIRETLSQAVKARLLSDVPTGVFLSGGVDSSLICRLMTELNLPEKTNSFTIGFDDPAYDERARAECTAKHINNNLPDSPLKTNIKVVSAGDWQMLKAVARSVGEPYADSSLLPTAHLCKFAREQVTVALSGDGADELFGGYERHAFIKHASMLDFLPERFRKVALGNFARCFSDSGERTGSGKIRRALGLMGAESAEERFCDLLNRCPNSTAEMLFTPSVIQAQEGTQGVDSIRLALDSKPDLPLLEKILRADASTYLPGDVLTKVDRASMFFGLEVRSPFLDLRMVELAAKLPTRAKISGLNRKNILKTAFSDKLPVSVFKNSKKGFGIPVGKWLRDDWKINAENALFSSGLPDTGFFQMDFVRRLWREHQSGLRDHSYLLWSLLMFGVFLDVDRG